LECSERTETAGTTDGYVDPAANPEHANLTQDELLNLAAADVQDLTPGPGGVVGPAWLGLAAPGLLLMLSVLLVRWRSRRRYDEVDGTESDLDRPHQAEVMDETDNYPLDHGASPSANTDGAPVPPTTEAGQ
jgi:hypothetical protein